MSETVCERCAMDSGESWISAADIDRMVRDLDVAMNGDGAAKQARLCDIHGQLLTQISALTSARSEIARLREALDGFGSDYMTSERHHPGYVLIPKTQFDRIMAARSALSPKE